MTTDEKLTKKNREIDFAIFLDEKIKEYRETYNNLDVEMILSALNCIKLEYKPVDFLMPYILPEDDDFSGILIRMEEAHRNIETEEDFIVLKVSMKIKKGFAQKFSKKSNLTVSELSELIGLSNILDEENRIAKTLKH